MVLSTVLNQSNYSVDIIKSKRTSGSSVGDTNGSSFDSEHASLPTVVIKLMSRAGCREIPRLIPYVQGGYCAVQQSSPS